MKIVSIIYRNRENPTAIEHIKNRLLLIFQDHITVRPYFIDEIPPGHLLDGDVFLVLYETMLYRLKSHIPNFNNVILMTRSMNKKYLPAILDIPKDTDVLIVNDSEESTIQTTYTLYELGVGHLNLIPYEPGLDKKGYYDYLDTAITANETDLVPRHITTIHNIGFREIGFDTLLKVMRTLKLDDDQVQRNLIRHIHTVVEPNVDFHANYLDSYLKSRMIDYMTQDPHTAILLTNEHYQLVFSNDLADAILNREESKEKELTSLLDESTFQQLREGSSQQHMLTIGNEKYIWEKHTIQLTDAQVMGHYISLKNEKSLRDLELTMSKHLIEKGRYARYQFHDIIYKSEAMKKCIDQAKTAALTDYTILVWGESGTGKELLAQSIHNHSHRASGPFVAVNCAALPESLLESELFGYEGGAFTGAQKNGKLGLFEQAHTGTIFLDEIGDISLNLQSRLLRTIQEKQVVRIGSDRVIDVDIRIIAATNQNLLEEVAQGNFRKDLYYRLAVIPITILPLRRRCEDILPLFQCFLGTEYKKLTETEKSCLLQYSWPGNVREIESTAHYYSTLSSFPDYILQRPPVKTQAAARPAAVSVYVPPAALSEDGLQILLLSLIAEHTAPYHGPGRAALLQLLRQKNIRLSDGKLRCLLQSMQQQGFVTVSRGRTGCRITPQGQAHLATQKRL